jgi:hypothetical protein
MSACCNVPDHRKSALAARTGEVLAWLLPSAILLLVPKCPACLAAYVALLTGIGLSLSTASHLRSGLFVVCVASFLFLTMRRLIALRASSITSNRRSNRATSNS